MSLKKRLTFIEEKMTPKLPQEIYDFRSDKTVSVRVLSKKPYWNREEEIWEVLVEFEDKQQHYAWYDESKQRWESGEL